MTQALKHAVVFEQSVDGYGAYVPDLPGCITVEDTLEETGRNIREAIAGHIEAMQAHGEVVPPPITVTEYSPFRLERCLLGAQRTGFGSLEEVWSNLIPHFDFGR